MYIVIIILSLGLSFELFDLISRDLLSKKINQRNHKSFPVKLSLSLLIILILKQYAMFVFIIVLIRKVYSEEKRKKFRKRVINFYGYKLFKYIINQLASGVNINEIIASMYLIVKDKELRKTLISVSVMYRQQSSIEESLEILSQIYESKEVDTLTLAIEQCVNVGENYKTLVQMEHLLFRRYIMQIQRDTKMRKKQSILSILSLCLIVILMISIPMLQDMMQAFNQIF